MLAVMPSPFLNSPDIITTCVPHEGLLSLSIAEHARVMQDILFAASAPFMKLSVTSSPRSFNTLANPLITESPSPLSNMDFNLGVGRPPSCSGHTGIRTASFGTLNFMPELFFRSNLHSKPRRHALTIIGDSRFTGTGWSSTAIHPYYGI